MRISDFKKRVSKLSLNFYEVEKIIVNAVRRHFLTVRFDFQKESLSFDSESLEVDRMRSQLTELSTHLLGVVNVLQPRNSTSYMESKTNMVNDVLSALER